MNRIFITGAGGFIGGRLVEILKENGPADIHILLRSVSKAARISRYPLNFYKGNITDHSLLRSAMQDCDTVVHCAHDFANPDANLLAAEIIAHQCREQNIKRLVYISSFAVHRTDQDGSIDEKSPFVQYGEYALNKLAVEKKLMQFYHKWGLPLIILRPTVVYGPFAGTWTAGTIYEMKEKRKIVPYNGEGICNAVYVDDIAQSILNAIDADSQFNGNAYLISGPPPTVTWKEFYTSHMLPGLQAPVYWNKQDSDDWFARLINGAIPSVRHSLKKDPIAYLKKTPVYTLYQRFLKSQTLKKKLLQSKERMPKPLSYPSRETFENLSCKCHVDSIKIKRDLGFVSGYTFSEGMKKTLLWIEWANLNSN